MSKALTFEQMENYLTDCARALFAAYDREVEPAPEAEADTSRPSVMSVIGMPSASSPTCSWAA